MTTKTPKKRQVMHHENISEYFISVINVHLIIHYHKDKLYACPDCEKVK